MSLQGLKLALAPPLWSLLCALVDVGTWCPDEPATTGPYIFACLHRDILPAIMFVRTAQPALLVSPSPDGDILVRTLGRRGYRFVRGATGEGGLRALVGLRRELDAGHSIGLAVDGPKGPYGVIQDGVLHLARSTRTTVVPLRAVSRRAVVLDTWDRTVVPLPGGGTRIEMGAPLTIESDEDTLAARRELARFFGVEGARRDHS